MTRDRILQVYCLGGLQFAFSGGEVRRSLRVVVTVATMNLTQIMKILTHNTLVMAICSWGKSLLFPLMVRILSHHSNGIIFTDSDPSHFTGHCEKYHNALASSLLPGKFQGDGDHLYNPSRYNRARLFEFLSGSNCFSHSWGMLFQNFNFFSHMPCYIEEQN